MIVGGVREKDGYLGMYFVIMSHVLYHITALKIDLRICRDEFLSMQ